MSEDDIAELARFTLERNGKVDVMVNNAIIDNPSGLLEDVTLQDWDDGIFCHMTAPLLFSKAVVPAMIEQGGGSIINVSSSNGLFGVNHISSYGPAKAGMINLTMSLAVTYGRYGIRANVLTPDMTLTEKKIAGFEGDPAQTRRQKAFFPLGSAATPEQLAEAMLFLASDESSAVTGQNLIADRGAAAAKGAVVAMQLEADARDELAAQGSAWITDEP